MFRCFFDGKQQNKHFHQDKISFDFNVYVLSRANKPSTDLCTNNKQQQKHLLINLVHRIWFVCRSWRGLKFFFCCCQHFTSLRQLENVENTIETCSHRNITATHAQTTHTRHLGHKINCHFCICSVRRCSQSPPPMCTIRSPLLGYV